MAEAETFFGQMLPEAVNSAIKNLEEKVAAEEAAGSENAAKLRAKLDGIKSIKATLRFELTGDGGRDYYFNHDGGTVSVGDSGDSDPIVTISQTLVAFDALQAAGATPVVGGDSKPGSTRGTGMLKPALVDAVAGLNKVLQLVINELPDGTEAATVIRLGVAATQDPDVTMTMSLTTYEQMTSGELPPPAAFMSGALKVDGDMALLMQMAQMGMTG